MTSRREEAEVVVVGAGPCGSTAASVLAELGHDVLLLDKDGFPRDKPCGDGLLQPAVATAERLGLGELIQSRPEIEAGRVVVAHRRETLSRFAKAPGGPRPRCITRSEFDAAMLGAACERGARFLQVRVTQMDGNGGGPGLRGSTGEGEIEVRGRVVIAADGATSRMRRISGAGGGRPTAYAIRQYFKTRRALEPVFEIYVPLEVDGQVVAGYGWVFPVDSHTANIGVGAMRESHARPTPLTRVLEAFVAELRAKAALRYGDLESVGEPSGSPVGMRSPLVVADARDVVLAGDAAGTVHPVTGEGIAFAMRSGEVVARLVHARSRRNGRRAPRFDARLWRSFPQLGIDTSAINRAWVIEMNRRSSDSLGSATELLGTVKQMIGSSAYDTGVSGTPAWQALSAHDRALGDALEQANGALLDGLVDRTPFVTEVIHNSIRSRLGPMYAATVLALAAGAGGEAPVEAMDAAVAAETVGVLPEILTMLVDRARSKSLRANNALAVLTGDFAATRALAAAATLGTQAVEALAFACQRGCEGGMRDATARFSPNRTVEDWFQAASETAGAAAVLAIRLGELVRSGAAADDELERFAEELGVAIRIAEEIVEFVAGDGLHPGREAAGVRRGIYPLPLLYATELDPALPGLLTRHTAGDCDAAEIIAAVRASGALDRAGAECAERSRTAATLASRLPGRRGAALATLADAPMRYVAEWAPAEQLAGVSGARSA